jgi:hypothetical protein
MGTNLRKHGDSAIDGLRAELDKLFIFGYPDFYAICFAERLSAGKARREEGGVLRQDDTLRLVQHQLDEDTISGTGGTVNRHNIGHSDFANIIEVPGYLGKKFFGARQRGGFPWAALRLCLGVKIRGMVA